ncbi:ATP-dependent DNA helicase RuvA [Bacillus coahuilensis m2-6]|uniref:Holliday junction branch migration complex subunit RuvA n=1 Tax=Bacillus coahuilensis p1.1.43 TaxID=1150625 RepID=A0A147K7G9_9BACI|nr:Holliday junction branch migration protein RuvA [Bacillus coahuilensis]KUP05929.1 ATP-dependent DNA helicase RuvA [Bacillus coahuilensis p1.1.43]KUP07005.1 ATP-dependent DNA helicase RuvA [Bacillus coahuilensis m2-6]
MYEYIKGTVEFIGPEYVVVEAGDIGYQLYTPNPFSFSPHEQKPLKVYTYQHVREDMISLYGFLTMEEKLLFMKLLNVTGIGPKGALAILGSGDVSGVIHAIEEENEAFLVKFPGVGKKTARQMILDLKGKLQDVVPDFFPNLFQPEKEDTLSSDHFLNEAILALKALGYSDRELKKVEPKLRNEPGKTSDEYIKRGLQLLLNT